MAPLNKKDQKIIDRLKATGYVGNSIQQDAPFKFLVRPFVTVGVDSLDLATWFENEIFSMVNGLTLESNISGIAIFPTIFDKEIGSPPKEFAKYKRIERSVSVGLNIEFSTWSSASRRQKLELLSDNIRRPIERIAHTYLSDQDRKRIIEIANQAHKNLIARLTH